MKRRCTSKVHDACSSAKTRQEVVLLWRRPRSLAVNLPLWMLVTKSRLSNFKRVAVPVSICYSAVHKPAFALRPRYSRRLLRQALWTPKEILDYARRMNKCTTIWRQSATVFPGEEMRLVLANAVARDIFPASLFFYVISTFPEAFEYIVLAYE